MRTDAPARCTLGITTILSITKIGFGEKGKPMVNYPTAMDTFVIICFGPVFAALIELAIITFITKYIDRYKAQEEKEREALEKLVRVVNEKLIAKDNINGILCRELINKIQKTEDTPMVSEDSNVVIESNKNLESIEIVQVDDENSSKTENLKGFQAQLKVYFNSIYSKLPEKYQISLENCRNNVSQQVGRLRLKPVPEMYIYSNTEEACEYIDKKARICFPTAFICIMSAYWIHYLYIYQDDSYLPKNE